MVVQSKSRLFILFAVLALLVLVSFSYSVIVLAQQVAPAATVRATEELPECSFYASDSPVNTQIPITDSPAADPGCKLRTTTINPSVATSVGDDPLADIPDCPDYFYTQPVKTGPLPPEAPECQLKTTTVDLKALLEQGYTLEELGIGADPPIPSDIDEDPVTAAAMNTYQ